MHTRSRSTSIAGRQGLWRAHKNRALQHAKLPYRLRALAVEHTHSVHQVLRRRQTRVDETHLPLSNVGWQDVRSDAQSRAVQRAGLPYRLCGYTMASLQRLHKDMWRRQQGVPQDYHNCGRARWHCVPAEVETNVRLQRFTVPCRLRVQRVGSMVAVHALVWCWHEVSLPGGGPTATARR